MSQMLFHHSSHCCYLEQLVHKVSWILTCIGHCVQNFLIIVLKPFVFHLASNSGEWTMECPYRLLLNFHQFSALTIAENPEPFLLICQPHQPKSLQSRHLGEITSEEKIAIMFVSGWAATTEERELWVQNPLRNVAMKDVLKQSL